MSKYRYTVCENKENRDDFVCEGYQPEARAEG